MRDLAAQLAFWGWAITGDALDRNALIAELRPTDPGIHFDPWDGTHSSLHTQMISDGTTWRRVPDWWALKHLPMSWREAAHAADSRAAA